MCIDISLYHVYILNRNISFDLKSKWLNEQCIEENSDKSCNIVRFLVYIYEKKRNLLKVYITLIWTISHSHYIYFHNKWNDIVWYVAYILTVKKLAIYFSRPCNLPISILFSFVNLCSFSVGFTCFPLLFLC